MASSSPLPGWEKELKNLAEKIAKCEKIIQANEDKEKVRKAEQEIMRISSSVADLDDLLIIDELVMEILEKN